LVGLGKAPVFAFVVGMVGCYQGLSVSASAASVGQLTTRSVVLAIFLVIVVRRAVLDPVLASRPVTVMSSQPVIRIRGLRTRFGAQLIHDGLDLEIRRGEIFGIVGGSGTANRSSCARSSA
jgi:ABC-type uncharacterized transport system ATPase subunit